MAEEDLTSLVLGWKVNASDDPKYWLGPGARPRDQPNEDLVCVPSAKMATHTVIIGQSGSGKSMFLGRLIEELLLNTRARCLILDPNSDFKRVDEVANVKLWKEAKFNTATGLGKLPHEAFKTGFSTQWERVRKTILVGGNSETTEPLKRPKKELKLWWPDLSVELIAEDMDSIERSELYHCHAYAGAVAHVIGRRRGGADGRPEVIKTAKELLKQARDETREGMPEETRRERISDMFGKKLFGQRRLALSAIFRQFQSLTDINRVVELTIVALDYVSEKTERFYFSRAEELQRIELLSSEAPSPEQVLEDLQVVDLPSIRGKDHQLLAVSAILETEWTRARDAWQSALEGDTNKDKDTRVPTFIVLDEAHNLLPSEPRDKSAEALRDQFRTYLAEGRKFGIFLILATQRPDKLDAQVLSECGNKAIMHLDSESILDLTRERLGLEEVPPRLLQKTLDFEKGRALLVGNWAPDGPEVLYCAARRTVEGGRNLREEYWAGMPERKAPVKPPPKPANKKRTA